MCNKKHKTHCCLNQHQNSIKAPPNTATAINHDDDDDDDGDIYHSTTTIIATAAVVVNVVNVNVVNVVDVNVVNVVNGVNVVVVNGLPSSSLPLTVTLPFTLSLVHSHALTFSQPV